MWFRTGEEKDGWSIRTVLRYTSFQLPGWLVLILMLLVVDQWLDISTWAMVAITVLWIGKDMAMFPFVWRAYDPRPSKLIAYRMVGERAVATERLSPAGYVRVNGELWQAELASGASAVEKGQAVTVIAVRGLTLSVQPEKQ